MSPAWFDDVSTPPTESRHDIQARALANAWKEGTARWGSELAKWRYSDLHALVLAHPMGRVPLVGRLLNRGVFAVGGSPTSIDAFGGPWVQGAQPVLFGPTMRWIADTADPDRSRAEILGGQAGHLADAHYGDQIQPFLRGETHAIQWSEAAIAKAAVSTLRLHP
jgi:penicillin amidase